VNASLVAAADPHPPAPGRDARQRAVSGAEWVFGIILFVINGISLVFDVVDSWRWLRGEREVPGLE